MRAWKTLLSRQPNEILKSVTQIKRHSLIRIICKWNEKDITGVTGGEQWDVLKNSDMREIVQYINKYIQTPTPSTRPPIKKTKKHTHPAPKIKKFPLGILSN